MYFKFFNDIDYNLKNKSYTFLDIFKRVAFSTSSLNNDKAFINHYIVEGETLESIANLYYGDTTASWLILMTNNIINYLDFPLPPDQIDNIINTQFTGKSFFFREYLKNLRPGDVMTNASGTNYGVVTEYNSIFRYVWCKTTSGLSEGDLVYFKRNNGNSNQDVNFEYTNEINGQILTANAATIEKIVDNKNSPVLFYDSNNNYKSPYYINSTLEARSNIIGIYTTFNTIDTQTITNTTLYSYMNGANIPLKTKSQQFIENNNKNRIIKILKPQYVNDVVTTVRELLSTDEFRIRTIEITNG